MEAVPFRHLRERAWTSRPADVHRWIAAGYPDRDPGDKGAVEAVEVTGHLIAIERALAALARFESSDPDAH